VADLAKTQPCICPGCPRAVPTDWVSGMCFPCATEDCEHDEGELARGKEGA
jgi:hypothetical protein